MVFFVSMSFTVRCLWWYAAPVALLEAEFQKAHTPNSTSFETCLDCAPLLRPMAYVKKIATSHGPIPPLSYFCFFTFVYPRQINVESLSKRLEQITVAECESQKTVSNRAFFRFHRYNFIYCVRSHLVETYFVHINASVRVT